MQKIASCALACAIVLGSTGCGSTSGGSVPPPASSHVFLVVEENHSYSEVIGNSSMPYLNHLANQYGLATQYYADVHPSIGNYLMLTTGQIETTNDSFSGMISDDSVVRELVKGGKSWRSYAESLPSIGYTGGDVYPYFRHHNPFSYFSDVNGTSQAAIWFRFRNSLRTWRAEICRTIPSSFPTRSTTLTMVASPRQTSGYKPTSILSSRAPASYRMACC